METEFPIRNGQIRFPMGIIGSEAEVMRNIQSSGAAFLQLSSMVLSPRSVEAIMDFIVQESLKSLHADRVSIFHMDKKDGILKAQFTQASRPENAGVGLFEEKRMPRIVLKESRSFLLKQPKDFPKLFQYVKGERRSLRW